MQSSCLVFGSFDGLHEGHLALLNFASQQGSVHIALATDDAIRELKSVHPAHNFEERKQSLLKTGIVSSVLPSQPGDDYTSIRSINPANIILGYDQNALKEHLLQWLKQHKLPISVITAPAHYPERYKTSLLYDRHQIDPRTISSD